MYTENTLRVTKWIEQLHYMSRPTYERESWRTVLHQPVTDEDCTYPSIKKKNKKKKKKKKKRTKTKAMPVSMSNLIILTYSNILPRHKEFSRLTSTWQNERERMVHEIKMSLGQ
ncbi:hypothetical protein BJ508DRAFT_310053 [Ascobolus immersus RN42]|uniref:Uncharacterized protein n=1 Tax=Ascobolus immersus RN42 TaxID=1160509 RepID=A0A3N4HWL7_ASCIM|nr:hypothetical protein BJ508DRAFT_310053 [Ascobolus immersus RN42]